MTKHAREVLEDCKVALGEIQDGIMGRQWRVRYVAAVALLRTVSYVLRNVDAPSDPLLKKINDKAWAQLKALHPEPKILWAFIEEERNNIVHEYRIGAGQGVTIHGVTAGTVPIAPAGTITFNYLMNEGPFKGRDQRDVIQEAIDWLDAYLSKIEEEYRKAKGTHS